MSGMAQFKHIILCRSKFGPFFSSPLSITCIVLYYPPPAAHPSTPKIANTMNSKVEDQGQGYCIEPGLGVEGGEGRGCNNKGRQADSLFDLEYDHYDAGDGGSGVPLPNFAPLVPDYSHGDDMSQTDGGSVGGRVYTNGSFYSRGGGYHSNDMRSQADTNSVASSRY